MHSPAWLAAFLVLAGTSPGPEPEVLKGPDIITAFEGRTVTGAYADGLAFRETYATGGGIAYWDPRGEATGQWSVTNDLFCTFYVNMNGACFRIERIGSNCFDFYAAAGTTEEALKPQEKPRYTARGSVTGLRSTCPDELQV